MRFPVFDLHCDTASKLIKPGYNLRENSGHVDLVRGAELAGYAQCFACFTTTGEGYNPVDRFEKSLAAIYSQVAANANLISIAYDAGEVQKNKNSGCMSAILTIEGPSGFNYDPELLEDLYRIGFRISTLSWNESNPLTGSHLTGGGLTELGKTYVKQAQKLGILVDVSHISDEGFWDIIDISNGPIVATHSNSRYICNVSRNLSDDMFRAICKTGGVVGINFYPAFLGENATVDTVCDHIAHFMELDPDGSHIALGGDLDGIDSLPSGFNSVRDYDILAQRLSQRGFDDQLIYKIFWNNALEVLANAVCK